MKRNKFSLSYYRLLSCLQGKVVPIGLTEVLPGDTIQHNTSLLVRSLQLNAPLMHPVNLKVHHWFVPHRLVWSNFEDFITGGRDGLNASVFPTMEFGPSGSPRGPSVLEGSLGDYLGLQIQATHPGSVNMQVSALPYRGYALIWNQWYRDNELQAPIVASTADGNDTTTNITLQSACWEKDYFTSSRPQPKLGAASSIPLQGVAYVGVDGSSTSAQLTRDRTTHALSGAGDVTTDAASELGIGAGNDIIIDPNGTLFADLSPTGGSSGMTVEALRETLAIQRYQEARSRYGSRYTEYLRYLNVRSSDARLQDPEYLGGGRATLQFSEVLQTAEGTNAVGKMRGHGISAMRTNRYRRFFEEHGYVFTMLVVRPKAIYTQGIPRHWNRRSKEDFWQKELEHIGQQEVLNKEIYSITATPTGVFGYQDRYDEYRRNESCVAGQFRSTLDFWHMARNFVSAPALNSAFVTCDPTTRVYPITNQDTLYVMANHSMQARRLVTRNATPRTF